MKVLDLFSGIGGFSLGLECAGFETVAFCEVDKKAQLVLKKHWPEVPIYDDVRTLTYEQLQTAGLDVDVICGGFPCQDISLAGKGAGLEGERSGLWYEFHRLIDEIKPQYAIIENVSALRSRGLDDVLRSLAEIGYDAEWYCIPASSVGAPHPRDRIWIVAYPNDRSSAVRRDGKFSDVVTTARFERHIRRRAPEFIARQRWQIESRPHGVAHGIPNRVDRLRQLGNSVVPQIPELIGKVIMDFEI